MEAWRRAEAQAWEKVEDGRWLGFWRLETRARKEWAELHKRQEEMRQRLDRESRTLLGRLRIWRSERSLREFVGAVRGREDLVEGWARGSRPVPQGRAGRAGQGTRRKRPADRTEGAGDLPKGAAGRGASRADGARNEGARTDMAAGARPRQYPHSPPPAPAPRSRAWRRRVRAMTLDADITMWTQSPATLPSTIPGSFVHSVTDPATVRLLANTSTSGLAGRQEVQRHSRA